MWFHTSWDTILGRITRTGVDGQVDLITLADRLVDPLTTATLRKVVVWTVRQRVREPSRATVTSTLARFFSSTPWWSSPLCFPPSRPKDTVTETVPPLRLLAVRMDAPTPRHATTTQMPCRTMVMREKLTFVASVLVAERAAQAAPILWLAITSQTPSTTMVRARTTAWLSLRLRHGHCFDRSSQRQSKLIHRGCRHRNIDNRRRHLDLDQHQRGRQLGGRSVDGIGYT